MKNGTGAKKDSAGNPQSETFESDHFEGAKITQTIASMPCDYYIGVSKANEQLTSKISKIDSQGNGSKVWNDLDKNGLLTVESEEKNIRKGKDVCVGVSSKLKLMPKKKEKIEFSFVWHSPQVKFPNSERIYSKYYTNYFDNGLKILEYSLTNYREWEKSIANWQSEVLEDK
jgi:uncharacterized protein (DUF608 family)